MKKNRTGFTLLELLTVIIIVGILGALALPNYMKAQRRSYSAEAWTNASAILEALKIYYVDNSYTWTTNIALLPIDNPNSRIGYGAKFSYQLVLGGSPNIPGIWADGRNITGSGSMLYLLLCTDCMQTNEAITRWECPSGLESCALVGG